MKENNNKVVSHKLNKKEIIKNVKEASLTSYGIKDISCVPNKKGKEDWIVVHQEKDKFSLEIHAVVAPHVKITEILRSCQKTVKFYMNHLYPGLCTTIEVYAEEISSNE